LKLFIPFKAFMRFRNITYFFTLFICFSCQAQKAEYNIKYAIAELSGIKGFLKLTRAEQKMDRLPNDSTWFNGTFRNNRSRIFLANFENGQLKDGSDSTLKTAFPAVCMCYLHKDTIYIKTWAGFFGVIGFNMKIYQDEFSSQYIIQIDQPDTFKTDSSDKKFTGQAVISNKYQQLTLRTKPNYAINEQLTGLLEITSKNYYEKKSENVVDTINVKARVYFTCKTRRMTLKDLLMK
jgi:hypothetical protein